MGTLYLVATPIGNLKDMSPRAVTTLKSVDLVLSEDTRTVGKLFKLLDITSHPPFLSYEEHNELKRIPEVVAKLKQNLNIALVSEAGTPTISDPGYKLVRECVHQKIKVSSIPGPCAAISALIVSGFPTDKFLFVGFLPKKSGQRKKLLEGLKRVNLSKTIIAYESPHRLVKSLKDIQEVLGNLEVCVCRELTKLHEEVIRAPIDEIIEKYQGKKVKGEVVLVFSPPKNQ